MFSKLPASYHKCQILGGGISLRNVAIVIHGLPYPRLLVLLCNGDVLVCITVTARLINSLAV